MTERFLNLDGEKQERIINAAISEFAAKGYDNASTNQIVKEANISKGILFHYFNSKKGLFLFLYDYCMDKCLNEYYKIIDLEDRDIILRLKKSAYVKMEMIKRFPKIFKFVQNAYIDPSLEIRADVEARNKVLEKENYPKVFDNIDISLFKDGVDIEKAINIIIWTLEGLSESQIEKAKLIGSNNYEYDRIYDEADRYIEFLRNCFYK